MQKRTPTISFRRFLRGLKTFLGLALLILEIVKRLSEP